MLGRLKKVDLRKEWKNEATEFTRWLAKKENLALLGEAIGIELRLLQEEADVGRYSLDILAEEEMTGHKVVIENQLEVSDHDHLGKIITYAAGHEAKFIIWIVESVREEHMKAIDWLNEHTDEETNFFLIKVELLQIDDSPLAPQFDVLSQPNDWAKTFKQTQGSENIRGIKTKQLEFWQKFKESVQNNTFLRLRRPQPQHWYDLALGSSECHISLTINSQEGSLGCELYIDESKELYRFLEAKKGEIESELGKPLEWMELPAKKASRIKLSNKGNISQEDEWPRYFEWYKESAELFFRVFGKYVKDYSKES